jgi:adenosylmethionine-8-amino-7-oxononanoate aminotransferase
MELLVDRASKSAPPARLDWPLHLRRKAMDKGLICYPGGGTADGRDGAHILLAPPFIYSAANVDELVSRLGPVLQDLPLA